MEYGFAIDQRKCIGCHACTVACKSENEVPVGSYRTWVKYVEKGAFPAVRRHFTVLRCNHCDAAPCVEICPVLALHKRPDAIVDLDRDQCIGCRACMQACPYDALYLDAESGVVEKCHYCAHRIESGLEPACVTVCPEEAIIAGDTSDPGSPLATLIREQPVLQRKPDKGTRPRVWYVDPLPEALEPGTPRQPEAWLWADRAIPPAAVPGFETPPDLVTTLDVSHPPAWGWHIWAYLFTKNVAAGAMLAAPFTRWLGSAGGIWPEVTALFFLLATGVLLVHDLGRPERCLKILFHANMKSWLVKGTWVLMVFGGVVAASACLRWNGDAEVSDLLRWIGLPLAALASGYTAFLLAQCRGRDLWLEPGLFLRLVARAALLGAGLAALLFAPPAGCAPFVVLALGHASWILLEHGREREGDAARAHALLWRSGAPAFAAVLLFVAAVLGFIGALEAALLFKATALAAAAAGLIVHERAWLRAGQEVPVS